jgi:hypothetical protein
LYICIVFPLNEKAVLLLVAQKKNLIQDPTTGQKITIFQITDNRQQLTQTYEDHCHRIIE